jgi:hypothetical protein
MKIRILLLSVGLILILGVGCSDPQDIAPKPKSFFTYNDDMKPLFDASCITCHSGATPPNNYDLTTYAGVRGNGSDNVPNAISGDVTSLIITKISTGHFAWNGDQAKLDVLIHWVVTDTLREN